MSSAQTSGAHLPREVRYDPLDVAVFGFVAILLVVGATIQATVYINHDVGWVLHSASWLLEGKQFGKDIVASNPPLIWWFSIPPAALAELGLSGPTAFRLYGFALVVLAFALSRLALRAYRDEGFKLAAAAILVSFAFAVLVRPGRDFGQREYFSIVLGMPYLLLAAGAVRGHSFARGLAYAAGVLAGIAFSLKPYFLLVPFGVEVYRFAVSTPRSVRIVFRPETTVMTLAIIGYVVAIPVLAPEYLRSAVPLFQSIYWGFERSATGILTRLQQTQYILPLLAGLLFFVGRRISSHAVILAIAALGYLASYAIQMKGYSYHGYPLYVALFMLVCLGGAELAARSHAKPLIRVAISAALVTLAILQCRPIVDWYGRFNLKSGPQAYMITSVIQKVEQLAPGGTIYAFSTHPFPGFPTVNYTSAAWGARSNSQFVVPAIVHAESAGIDPSRLEAAERYQRSVVLKDFLERPPDLVLLDAGEDRHALGSTPFDDIAFYSEDPVFAEIWSQYVEVEQVANIRFFVRRESGAAPEVRGLPEESITSGHDE